MNPCEKHPDKENELFCCDCKAVMCINCKADKHDRHKCIDVKESAQMFRTQLKDDIKKIASCALQSQKKLEQIEISKKHFLLDLSATEKKISRRYEEVLVLIQLHRSQLMEELSSFKDKRLKEMENIQNEVERQFVILDNFKLYCQEMTNKGTACVISRDATDLHSRTEEIVKTKYVCDDHVLNSVDIQFTASLVTSDSVKNFVGELGFKRKNDVFPKCKSDLLSWHFYSFVIIIIMVINTG